MVKVEWGRWSVGLFCILLVCYFTHTEKRDVRFSFLLCVYAVPVCGEIAQMAVDPEELLPRKKPADIVLGEDISAFSAFELKARIAMLEEEIQRCRTAITAREASRSAADAFFKR